MRKKVSANESRRRQQQASVGEWFNDGEGGVFQMKKSKLAKHAYELNYKNAPDIGAK
ncbi:hypothetical protein [Providencia rustigianii]|uniref:hypothetical protein n=1 Tax=Providencia rustigianii TaxID=158850 RepID=UPI002240DE94|nr:hypothetical protein [Providencia rustigianii]